MVRKGRKGRKYRYQTLIPGCAHRILFDPLYTLWRLSVALRVGVFILKLSFLDSYSFTFLKSFAINLSVEYPLYWYIYAIVSSLKRKFASIHAPFRIPDITMYRAQGSLGILVHNPLVLHNILHQPKKNA